MTQFLKLSTISLVLLAVLDYIWIGFIANTFYRTQYGPLFSSHPVLWAAGLFYVIYAFGLAYFAVGPAVRAGSIKLAVGNGAFLALVAFGTYDLTSLSITTNWPVLLSVVDMSWGVFEGALASGLAYLIAVRFFKS